MPKSTKVRTATQWRTRILNACKKAGTYQPCFDDIINSLAALLNKIDEAEKLYKESGSKVVVSFTNKNGSKNIVKNPILASLNDMKSLSLSYWKELGLTPASIKKINEESFKVEKPNSFAAVLKEVVNGS